MVQKRVDQYFVITPPGFEKVCAQEMLELGLTPQNTARGGVAFTGGLRELYLANLWLRSASRILVRLGEVRATDFPTLYQRLGRLPWGRFIRPGQACQIRVASHGSRLTHRGRIAKTCRSAIGKALGGPCPEEVSGQKIYLRMVDDLCQVSLDSSGEHLHRRGYRRAAGPAPLRENLAAGCLLACGYDASLPLIDLMTGAGTFAVEAALIGLRRAPGMTRSFAFMDWPKYRAGLWQQLQLEARNQEGSALPAAIVAIDNNPRAVAAVRENLATIDLAQSIQVQTASMQQIKPPAEEGMLICNPPYGERLGRDATLTALYRDIGRTYGEKFSPWQGAILIPQGPLIKSTSLSLELVCSFANGGIKVDLWRKRMEDCCGLC